MKAGRVYVSRARRGLGWPEAYRLIRQAVFAALETENVDVPCEVNVLLADDKVLHELNNMHRGVDRPTDVLSFPQADLIAGAFDPEMAEFDYDTGRYNLGDMAVSVDKIREQAKEYGNTVLYELSYLTVHSCLHLLGYDHLDEGEQKKQMRTREKEIMKILRVR